jgi:hypothetical protein
VNCFGLQLPKLNEFQSQLHLILPTPSHRNYTRNGVKSNYGCFDNYTEPQMQQVR